jgi:hypothetical protein
VEKDTYFPNTQKVGLEAAILERKRNSSLAEKYVTEDVTGLKHDTETRNFQRKLGLVGERSCCTEGEL